MGISRIDHLVLTVSDIDRTVAFYERAMGMTKVVFGEGRVALAFGQQKLNLHQHGAELEPHSLVPTPGSADFCLVSDESLHDVIARLGAAGVPIVEGPVGRTGATGPITSVYVRDPDDNLVEISSYDRGRPHAAHPYDLLPPVPAMRLHSDAVAGDGTLGSAFVLGGDNQSPPLAWSTPPSDTRSLALTCFDPDAPTGAGFFHWYVVGIEPTVTQVAAGWDQSGAIPLRNDFGNRRYDGAAPPAGDGPHRYVFAIHALDATADELGLEAAPSLAAAGFSMHTHVLARGALTATYAQ